MRTNSIESSLSVIEKLLVSRMCPNLSSLRTFLVSASLKQQNLISNSNQSLDIADLKCGKNLEYEIWVVDYVFVLKL